MRRTGVTGAWCKSGVVQKLCGVKGVLCKSFVV